VISRAIPELPEVLLISLRFLGIRVKKLPDMGYRRRKTQGRKAFAEPTRDNFFTGVERGIDVPPQEVFAATRMDVFPVPDYVVWQFRGPRPEVRDAVNWDFQITLKLLPHLSGLGIELRHLCSVDLVLARDRLAALELKKEIDTATSARKRKLGMHPLDRGWQTTTVYPLENNSLVGAPELSIRFQSGRDEVRQVILALVGELTRLPEEVVREPARPSHR